MAPNLTTVAAATKAMRAFEHLNGYPWLEMATTTEDERVKAVCVAAHDLVAAVGKLIER